jgi:hypothetical protein
MSYIIAILPIQVKGKGLCSQIFYTDGTRIDQRSCSNFLKNMCDEKNISARMMRKNIKEFCGIKRNLPRAIDSLNVFFSFKFKESIHKEERRAYVNCRFVKKIQGSDIILETGETLSSLQKEDSLTTSLAHARSLMYMMLCQDLLLQNEKEKQIIKEFFV